jgi:hypothetical protein
LQVVGWTLLGFYGVQHHITKCNNGVAAGPYFKLEEELSGNEFITYGAAFLSIFQKK